MSSNFHATEVGRSAHPPLRAVIVLEQTLGHVTHGKNLQRLLPEIDGFEPTFVLVPFDVDGWRARVPGFGNWTIRAGVRVRRSLRQHRRHRRDALVVHTQVPAVLLGRTITSTPTIVSLDATPQQYDSLGEHYAHDVGPAPVERVKSWLNRRCFERAAHLVTWTEWTRQSLINDYGITPDKITVIPPGVDTERWVTDVDHERGDAVVRILFVGGDLGRKGGHHLIEAFTDLRSRHGDAIELHLVTTSPVEAIPGVVVHDSMTPNSEALIALYHRCHIFCLPTLGDCLPMVLPEAGAAGLALVSTDVGAISDIVRDGETGLLVPVADVAALSAALERVVEDRSLRATLAAGARALVAAQHDAAHNAQRLVDVIRSVSAT